jgi:hypothetical protein
MEFIEHYSGCSSLASLRRALMERSPAAVVPCDEGVVAQLHVLHRQEPSLRTLIEASLGPPDSYPYTMSRRRFLDLAKDLNITVPVYRVVSGTEDLLSWHREMGAAGVLKVDGMSAGEGVRISNSLDESLRACQELRKPLSLMTAWKRLCIDRDPLALWKCRNSVRPEITVQRFIQGRPANLMMSCWRGKVLSSVPVVVVATEGRTGAATIFRRLRSERMMQAAELIAARLQLSGFYGLDFVIESDTSIPYLIELNPRCTQLGHLDFPDQGCLVGILAAALRGAPRPRPDDPIQADTIAIFPQALAAGKVLAEHLKFSYLDVPRGESLLVEELKLVPWPQRQWAARLYHAFRPPARKEAVVFEEADFSSGRMPALARTAGRQTRA